MCNDSPPGVTSSVRRIRNLGPKASILLECGGGGGSAGNASHTRLRAGDLGPEKLHRSHHEARAHILQNNLALQVRVANATAVPQRLERGIERSLT